MAHEVSSRPHVVVLDPHSAGLAIARRTIWAGGTVTVIAESDHAWETRSRGVERIVVPFDVDNRVQCLAALQRCAAAHADREVVVLPATDHCCELLVREGGQLPANIRMFERSGGGHLALMDKDTADTIARRAGVAVPWTARIRSEAELAAALAAAPWPCVVKPVFSHEWRARYGEARAFLVSDAAHATSLLERPLLDGVAMLLCQYIPGGDDDVEEAIVVRLADGSYPVRFGCRKLRQYPRGFGATALGESSLLPETMAIAQRVLDEAGFVGVAGVEVKRHAETDERWFLEVNVRVPGQWGLGDACGVQATPRLVAALCGHELSPQPPLRPGVRIVVPDIDVRVCREVLHETPVWRRPAVALRFLRPWVGARELGLLDLRDPRPGFAWVWALIGRRLNRLIGLLGQRGVSDVPERPISS